MMPNAEQAHCVCNGCPAFPHPFRDLFLSQPEFVHQLSISARLFQRVQVGTLHVLNQSQLEHLLRSRFFDDRGHGGQSGQLGRTPTPLTGDELVFVADLGDDQRLDHAVFADGSHQFRQ
jgi:hypothetical protein